MRHKHADLIHAWAEGAEIQKYNILNDGWIDVLDPSFNEGYLYRIKPRPTTVKREGWAAIYSRRDGGGAFLRYTIYTSEDATKRACPKAMDVIKIEWEEEI